MTFQQILLEAIDLHFAPDEFKLAIVRRWINLAEVQLWNAADWQFKRVPAANLTVTAGVATMPADFARAHRLYNSNGDELTYLEPDTFEAAYSVGATPPTGPGSDYTVINRQIKVGPADTATYKLAYRRRYAHLNAASAVVPGTMALSDDTPLWDAEHHYILVPWAMVIGGELADPAFFARGHVYSSANIYEQTRDEALAAMKDELVRGETAIKVWGESSLERALWP